MNLEKCLPHLLSWENGFALGRMVKLMPRYLKLTLQYHPEPTGGRRWAVWCHRLADHQGVPGEFFWRLDLPVRTETAARMILAQISQRVLHRREPVQEKAGASVQDDLTESQLRFLAKQYPRTIALFRAGRRNVGPAEKPDSGDELKRAFVEETFARSKVVLEPVTDGEQVLRMAKLFAKMTKRKRKSDLVEYELIVGCYAKGYCSMKLSELRLAVGSAVGYKPTVEALRKKWARLKLPSRRRRGRPGKNIKIRPGQPHALSVFPP